MVRKKILLRCLKNIPESHGIQKIDVNCHNQILIHVKVKGGCHKIHIFNRFGEYEK